MTSESNPGAASRRAFLQGGAVIAAAATATLGARAEAQAPAAPAAGLGSTSNSKIFFVADTASGKVEGIVNAGIIEFKGIPYGAPTGGRNRFMPPKRPQAWVSFATTGDPSHAGIGHWPAYDAATRATMVFNDDTRVENDPRGAMRRYWA